MRFLPSPNFNARRPEKNGRATIQHLILHYTGMRTAGEAIQRLCDPASEVSAHYVVDTDGAVTQLVDEENRAWHAGQSFWAGETDINSTSIGIEIVNPGHEFGYVPYPPGQISAVIKLCLEILSHHAIPPHHVLAHSDIAPARKMDPGELFPWAELAAAGVGLWPSVADEQTSRPRLVPDQWSGTAEADELEKYGYDVSDLPAAIAAFKRHFYPQEINKEWNDECGQRLDCLLVYSSANRIS